MKKTAVKNKMGRPSLPASERLGVIVPCRMSRAQYRVLSEISTKRGQPFITRFVRDILASAIPEFAAVSDDKG